jgi:hypothetical protein
MDRVAVACPGRPAPEQISVYVCAAGPFNITVVEPEVASVPDHVPLAVQDEAFALDHVRVALCPGETALGEMERLVLAGGACGGEMAVFAPEQPERTKAKTRSGRMSKDRDFLDSAGNGIGTPSS